MDTTTTTFEHLFQQLGLDSSEESINQFIEQHKLAKNSTITQAGFWSESQRHFIEEALNQDGQWSELVDQLDVLLRN
ncbi:MULTISPECIES: DUF2789 domain-containing protein [unclassified Shewanella]|uniref:DUF2789 domain-containing protein n=1 Tax=unclassified Shewanella TaxID=196818 RepID=UPI000C815753|nr:MULTISPECIES: DUF2789 domain-containing protein [unclassified Shewanella]MDO6678378.1 DUF2789 domain-containing protein [Shewanella sp. 4_MG-2023]PMH96954.1 hypothetical protein BCU55_19290 [Shewanella sp. 10N.286.48.A6]